MRWRMVLWYVAEDRRAFARVGGRGSGGGARAGGAQAGGQAGGEHGRAAVPNGAPTATGLGQDAQAKQPAWQARWSQDWAWRLRAGGAGWDSAAGGGVMHGRAGVNSRPGCHGNGCLPTGPGCRHPPSCAPPHPPPRLPAPSHVSAHRHRHRHRHTRSHVALCHEAIPATPCAPTLVPAVLIIPPTASMVLRKHELEGKLGEERVMIDSGVLRDENPLDQSAEFEQFLLACRHGDLRRCQELIGLGVNINAKDSFDYTPLIIVSALGSLATAPWSPDPACPRPAYAGTTSLSSCCSSRVGTPCLAPAAAAAADAASRGAGGEKHVPGRAVHLQRAE